MADASPNSTGTPTGTVSFFDGSTLLGTTALSGGTAGYATAALTPGVSHTLTASYSGDAYFSASSSGAATYSFKIAPQYGVYPGAVTFSAAGLPAGAVATFSPASIASSGGAQSAVLTMQTASPSAKTDHPFEREAPLALAVLLLPFLSQRRVRRGLLGLVVAAAVLSGVVSISDCGATEGFKHAGSEELHRHRDGSERRGPAPLRCQLERAISRT